MKRNLTLLTIVGALIAVAVPASAAATTVTVTPAGHKFESSGIATLSGVQNGCTLLKLKGNVPSTGNSGTTVTVPLSTVQFSCANASLTIAAGQSSILFGPNGQSYLQTPQWTIRQTGAIGCKLVTNGTITRWKSTWSNGTLSPFTQPTYNLNGSQSATWTNDVSACPWNRRKR